MSSSIRRCAAAIRACSASMLLTSASSLSTATSSSVTGEEISKHTERTFDCQDSRATGPGPTAETVRSGTARSAPLEVADQLPVGDRVVVEDDLLLARHVQQVLEHVIAEPLPERLAAAHRVDRLV